MKRPKALPGVVLGAAVLMGGVLLSGAAGTSRLAADTTTSHPAPAASAATLRVDVASSSGAGDVALVVQCETPTKSGDGIDISAATAVRHTVAVAPGAPGAVAIDGQVPGSRCTVTQADPSTLVAVSGGSPVHDTAGALTGVRATLDGGETSVSLENDLSGARPAAP